MSYDKIVDSAILEAGMTETANAIREKTGATEQIPWEVQKGFASAISAIPGKAKDARVTLTQNIGSSGTFIYEQNGKLTLVTIAGDAEITLPVGSFLEFRSIMRSQSQSYPTEPTLTVNGADYENFPIMYSYSSGSQSIQRCNRRECIFFLIKETNVTIDVRI